MAFIEQIIPVNTCFLVKCDRCGKTTWKVTFLFCNPHSYPLLEPLSIYAPLISYPHFALNLLIPSRIPIRFSLKSSFWFTLGKEDDIPYSMSIVDWQDMNIWMSSLDFTNEERVWYSPSRVNLVWHLNIEYLNLPSSRVARVCLFISYVEDHLLLFHLCFVSIFSWWALMIHGDDVLWSTGFHSFFGFLVLGGWIRGGFEFSWLVFWRVRTMRWGFAELGVLVDLFMTLFFFFSRDHTCLFHFLRSRSGERKSIY